MNNVLVIFYKCLFFIVILQFICLPVLSYDLDTSVNKEIEKKYDSNKLKNDMNVKQTAAKTTTKANTNKAVPKTTPIFDNTAPNVNKTSTVTTKNVIQKTGVKIPSGTKFSVKSDVSVSGWSGVNSLLSFTSTTPVYKTNITIPAGTKFHGVISASHAGQITGNGGLIKIKITSMTLNGKTVQVEGKITKANSKNIFFNNIKGARQYLQGVENRISQGVNFYNKTRNLSQKMSSNPVGTILAVIPTVTGMAGAATCTITSPITGLIQKGKNISLPSGTLYEIKLTNDAYLN